MRLNMAVTSHDCQLDSAFPSVSLSFLSSTNFKEPVAPRILLVDSVMLRLFSFKLIWVTATEHLYCWVSNVDNFTISHFEFISWKRRGIHRMLVSHRRDRHYRHQKLLA
mmetsp:Transcript_18577/g.43485  ORF Transcript_18577/g.43485 Transcript_18577/m.43485 type:complete len:109 (+) Transcript_18577:213-539(+)